MQLCNAVQCSDHKLGHEIHNAMLRFWNTIMENNLPPCWLLEQDAMRERYRLGMKLFEYGSTVLGNMELHRVAGPFVGSLTRPGQGAPRFSARGTGMAIILCQSPRAQPE